MKIQTVKQLEYINHSGDSCKNKINPSSVSFAADLPAEKTPFIDKILKNKFSQKLFNLASKNPHAFNLTAIGLMGILLRPVGILVIPGAKKEDKQYAAAKSSIGTVITVCAQLAFCIPLALLIEKLAKEALKNPSASNFPQIKTPKFEAFNYFVNNGFSMILAVFISMLVAKTLTVVMKKFAPEKDENSIAVNNFGNKKSNSAANNVHKVSVENSGVNKL